MKIASSVVLIVLAISSGYIYGRRGTTPPKASTSQAPTGDYTCPMHPFIIKDRAGACAICGMELVKKTAGNGLSDKELLNVSHVALSPAQQVMANLATTVVAVQPFSREITCTGIVSYNQERQAKVSAWLAGRLDRLLVKSIGSEVRKDRPVAEIYSLDLYNAQEQYLLAYKTIKLLNSTVSAAFPANTQMALGEATERLRMLGFRGEQFEQLHTSTTPSIRIPIYSPLSGVVTEKFVQEGQYVTMGEPLFAIADLSRIWVELELFESDFPQVKVGQDVVIMSQSYPGEPFYGKVKLIYPFLDAKTRTVKLRVELPNPGLKLKPEMYVKASIRAPMADSLAVPVGAVTDTGTRQVVWVESKPGVFMQRDVRTGVKTDRIIQILSGLKSGEKIATTGSYLIDSEAQLSHKNPASPAAAPPPAGTSGLDMSDMKMPEQRH